MVVMGGDWSWLRWEVLVCWWLKVVVDSGGWWWCCWMLMGCGVFAVGVRVWLVMVDFCGGEW